MEVFLQARECTGAPRVRDFGTKIGRLEEEKFCTSRLVPPFPTKTPMSPTNLPAATGNRSIFASPSHTKKPEKFSGTY